MIFQSFILENLVFLCMKIINSIVVVGLYYGFLTTFSIGPSYLFLLRARLVEEGTEKKISATTGFITGQLIMFISIYYTPLHLALGRPHTITVIAIPYLFFHFFGNSKKNFLNYGYKNPNSIRNFSIQRIFFQNLSFQFLNPLFLPSSIFIRLVNIYLFRCNNKNKLLFLTSSFIGWIIGHTFFMKWIEFFLVCIRQKNLIQSNTRIQRNKYILPEFINSMFKIFVIFLFVTCLYYLGRIPPPFLNKKLLEIKESNEISKKGKKMDVEKNLQRIRTKQKRSNNKNITPYPFLKKEHNLYKMDEQKYKLQKPVVNILFNYKRWNRPFRYIKKNQFENIVKNEISEFFFHTCQSDGREKISFTYPPNLSIFEKMMETKMDVFIRDQISYDELSNHWTYRNEEKRKKLSSEFINRTKLILINKEFISLDIFENRIRLCNDETQKKYLTKRKDPFLKGPFRGRIKKGFSTSIQQEKTYKKNHICINKIQDIFFFNKISKKNNSNYPKLEENIKTLDKKLLVTRFFFNLISKFSKKLVSNLSLEALYLFPEHDQVKMNNEEKKLIIKMLFEGISTSLNDKTKVNRNKTKYIKINEISKKVPRWSYKFVDELKELGGKIEADNSQIRSRKAKRVVIFTNKYKFFKKYKTSNDFRDTENTEKKKNELGLRRYSQQSDFRRDIIKGSIRAQRRKTVTWKFFQKRIHSPLFFEKMEKSLFFSFDSFKLSFDSFKLMKIFFMLKIWIRKKTEFKILGYIEEKTKKSRKKEPKKKENEERKRIEIAEAWDSIIFAQVIRGVLLITQCIIRKYILLPSLIIMKNMIRILFFQFPEWSEDYRDWKREIYIKCTYNGVQLSEREFPQKWLTDGIQIKILFPFRLKPWHKSKIRSNQQKEDSMKKKNFCFLTVWGMEVELPFSSSPKNRFSFFDPILKELKKKTKQFEFFIFLILKVFSKKFKLFLNILIEKVKWMIKSIVESIREYYRQSIVFFTKKIKQFFKFIFIQMKPPKIDELSENQKNSTICKNNLMISEATFSIQSINSKNCSLKNIDINDLNAKRKVVLKKIEKMKKEEKKRGLEILETNIHSNKTIYTSKRIELEKKFLQKLQRRNVRLTNKSHSFFQFFIKKIYIDIFLYIICIPRIHIQLFLESTKKILNKWIYDNEANAEKTYKPNQSIIPFISNLHKYLNTRNANSQNSCDVSFLSQAYVFLNLLQTRIIHINIYKLIFVFQYHKNDFLKNEIKDSFFGAHGIFHSKLKQKNLLNSIINQWTNWLKNHYYQYDLSNSRWSRLVSQKWRNRITKCGVSQNKNLTKWDSYGKSPLILDKEQQVGALKKKIRKQYRYNLLSYNLINYPNKKDSNIYLYRSLFQSNKNASIYSNYNTYEKDLFNIISNLFIKNFIAEDTILIDMEKNMDRKYFDWMGINREILNRSILNPEFWFFSKFVIFYNAYRGNSQIIPIQLHYLHSNVNKNVSENKKNITRKKKRIDVFRASKKKEFLELELETRNLAKGKYPDRINLELSCLNQEKYIKNNSIGRGSEKNSNGIKKKKAENKMEAELNLLLRNFLTLHLNWKNLLGQKIFNNVKVYSLLIRLKNFREITIASIQRGELGLDIMMIQNQKNFTLPGLRKNKNNKFRKKEIFVIEPVRLSRKNQKPFFKYQTMGISLIHKNKRKIYKKYSEKIHVNKKYFDKYIPRTRNQKITEKKENYNLLVPENILSARRRRELRILICLDPNNINSMHRNTIFYNENKVKNCFQVLTKKRNEKDQKKLMNFKIFLWPKYRLEDLACINRFWFNTHNGSRFSIVRIQMYPRVKIR